MANVIELASEYRLTQNTWRANREREREKGKSQD